MRRYLAALLLFFAAYVASAQTTLTPNLQLQLPAYQQTNWQVPIDYNFTALDLLLAGSATLPTGPTPTISQTANWTTANTTSTAITNFGGGLPGQNLRIFCGAGDTFTTIANGSNISVPAAFSCATASSISFVLFGSVWTETGTTSQVLGGTVTSVALTVPSWLTVAGSPVTASGTLAVTPATGQTAHQVIGTGAGSTYGPVTLTTADLPTLFYQTIEVAGTPATQETTLNFIAGTNITIACPTVSSVTTCTFTASSTASTAFSGLTASTNSSAGTFAATGNTWNFAGTTLFRLRAGAGATTTVNGDFAYDTTNGNWHAWNGADLIHAPLAAGFVSGDCGEPTSTGGQWVIADSGQSCATGGSGNMTVYNTLHNAAAGASISSFPMVTVGGTDTNYSFGFQITQTNTTAGCATNPTFDVFLQYTDALNGVSYVSLPMAASSDSTASSLAVNLALTKNTAPGGANSYHSVTKDFRGKSGTTVSVAVGYVSGTCSTEAAYTIAPVLVQQ